MKIIGLSKGFFAKVDDDDYRKLNKYKWHVSRSSNSWYVRSWIDGNHVYMHRYIMNPTPKEQVNHKNGDTMDHRRENLEVCSQQYNLKCRKW